ncbi:MAG: SGNH/GDSL hydrolase family protein [Ilumatobacteraceae bacterium]
MRTRVILLVVAMVSGGLVITPQTASAEVLFDTVVRDAPGPLGPIAVVGDSLMLGSAYEAPLVSGWGPSLAQLLADRGWGPVRMVAGVGFQAGKFLPNLPSANMSKELIYERSIGFDPAVIVVSLGPNDMLNCNGSVDCAVDDILGLVDTAGPDHEVWWAMQTMKDPANQAAWNQALQTAAAQRPNLTLWDWPSIVASTGIQLASDNTHLPGPAQYLARSVLMADDVTTRLGASRHVGAAVPPPAGGTSYDYQPVDPTRVIDTRDTGQRLAAGGTLRVDLSALDPTQVGPDAAAVAINVTAAGTAAAGYLTVWPCDNPQPVASSVDFLAGQARAAQATTLLGPGRTVCIFSNAATDVVVDLQGVFTTTAGALHFQPVTPDRKIDTRNTGRSSLITVQAPPGAAAVAATLTVTGGKTAGFLSAFPCSGTIPKVSNVDWEPGETIAGAAFVPVAADGTFCVFTNSPTDVIVDITGVFSAASTLHFTPVAPTRMLDTRIGTGGWRGRQGVGQTIEIGAAPATAQAVTGTITMVDPGLDSYLTGTICGQPAGVTSSVNGAAASVIANSLTVGLSAGGDLCITSLASSHTLFDTTGWWAP